MTALSDHDDPFTAEGPDAMEMYDRLRRARREGMYARLYAEIAVTAAAQPPLAVVPLLEPEAS